MENKMEKLKDILKCNYINGYVNGEYKEYSEDGVLLSHKIYENDIIIQTIL